MASSINASTTSGIVQTADTSGILNLQSNGTTIASVSSTGVAVTGNITASGATGGIGYGPAFSAYATSIQTGGTTTTFVKILFGTERFDTNNNYASSTFTPTVAGYYQLNASVGSIGSAASLTRDVVSFYFNGVEYIRAFDTSVTQPNGTHTIVTISAVIYFNGSTDYVDVYALGVVASGTISYGNNLQNTFNGCLVRSA